LTWERLNAPRRGLHAANPARTTTRVNHGRARRNVPPGLRPSPPSGERTRLGRFEKKYNMTVKLCRLHENKSLGLNFFIDTPLLVPALDSTDGRWFFRIVVLTPHRMVF
jgi:hypothetical protein